jgi:hypothetical protein
MEIGSAPSLLYPQKSGNFPSVMTVWLNYAWLDKIKGRNIEINQGRQEGVLILDYFRTVVNKTGIDWEGVYWRRFSLRNPKRGE